MTDKQKQIGYLEDTQGGKSSKRLFGAILLTFGMVMTAILFYVSIVNPDSSYNTSKDLIEACFFSGASLLGIGVCENFFHNRSPKQ